MLKYNSRNSQSNNRSNHSGGNHSGGFNLTANDLQILASVLTQRNRVAGYLGKQFNGYRSLYEVCGYKYELKYEDYLAAYDRNGIAARVVDSPCETTWKSNPEISEDGDGATETEFEKAWKEMVPSVEANRERTGKSKKAKSDGSKESGATGKGQNGNQGNGNNSNAIQNEIDIYDRLKVFHYLERADILSGIGRFGILLIGVRGGAELKMPLEDGSLSSPQDILYLHAYPEGSVEIVEWETDPSNERFGRPKMYRVDLSSNIAGFKNTISKVEVHWSRVIHIAEDLREDEIFGEPRMKKVFNWLYDIDKVAGGGAEMFWQGAYGGLVASTKDGFTFDPEGSEGDKLKNDLQEYVHGLRRFFTVNGMDINRLGVELGDPKNIFEILISLISGDTHIPKRILIGSERGELASSQDEDNWFGHIQRRRTRHAEPMILRPFIDWCIKKGALPYPKNGYIVKWQPLYESSEKEKSEVALNKARTLKEYAPPGATGEIVPPAEFREKILEMDPEPDEKYLQWELGIPGMDGTDEMGGEDEEIIDGGEDEVNGDGNTGGQAGGDATKGILEKIRGLLPKSKTEPRKTESKTSPSR